MANRMAHIRSTLADLSNLTTSNSNTPNWESVFQLLDKFNLQLNNNYINLPNLNTYLNNKLLNLLPKYEHSLFSVDNNNNQQQKKLFLYNQMSKFYSKEEVEGDEILNSNSNSNSNSISISQINHLKAHIIKHEIHSNYFQIRNHRLNELSIIKDPLFSNELLVHTYCDVELIHFIKLLNNDSFLHSKGICSKLRPSDLEKLIQLFIYSNKALNVKERQKLKINDIINNIIQDLKNSNLKLSNKELFTLLQFTLKKNLINDEKNNENTDSGDSGDSNIIKLYDNFINSTTFEKDSDFFINFLRLNISLSFGNNKITSKTFVEKILKDIVKYNVPIDRLMLKYILKFASIEKNSILSKIIIQHILETYPLDSETFTMVHLAISKLRGEEESKLLNKLTKLNNEHDKLIKKFPSPPSSSYEETRFNTRILDHLIDKESDNITDNNGFLYRENRNLLIAPKLPA
ncbi:hypothetical protein DAPK24_051970 [Pichia kluyveri]|uniref:Uncharacterized protein n=1 Tax=Pichia kluyveri TaxID=36015 RepID=A0AAV5RAV4_PICKL|nr:hypothetical protein DAPK24_051970 [Pichia kluyveri]